MACGIVERLKRRQAAEQVARARDGRVAEHVERRLGGHGVVVFGGRDGEDLAHEALGLLGLVLEVVVHELPGADRCAEYAQSAV